MDRYYTGKVGEELTAYYLSQAGYTILCRNYRIRGGEIDIIAAKDGIIAFVEVKTRAEDAWENGSAAVTRRKKRLIMSAAERYMLENDIDMQPRYDIAEVTMRGMKPIRLNYLDNAYDASE